MENNVSVVGIVTTILIVVRLLFDDNQQLPLIIASINLAALLMVVFSIASQIKNNLIEIISKSGVPQEIIDREQKKICIYTSFYIYIPLLVFYIVYLLFFCSELVNDIISIASLGLSISDTFIAKLIVGLYKE